VENSATDGGVVVARMLSGQGNFGFDASRKEYVDLVEAGIVDPAKVVRTALENASICGRLIRLRINRLVARSEFQNPSVDGRFA
jgi:chaperonin GroEL (HSP60 family)